MKFVKNSVGTFFPKRHLILVVTLILTLAMISKSDLPSHCLSASIEGEWTIYLGGNNGDKHITCGHKMPDKNLDHINSDVNSIPVVKQVVVTFERPNFVYSKEKELVGRWTMIYDEGFEFNINEQLFFAFSKYKKVGFFAATNKDNSDTPGYENYCGETFLGWFHDQTNNSNWGCYFGIKSDRSNTISKSSLTHNNSLHNVVQTLKSPSTSTTNNYTNKSENFLDSSSSDNGPINEDMISSIPHMDIYGNTFLEMEADLNLKLFEPDYSFVEKINNDKNSLWTAKVHEDFVGRTYSYMRKILGISNLNNSKGVSSSPLSVFLESEIKSSLNLEESLSSTNKHTSKDKTKLKNQTKVLIKDKIKNKLSDKSKVNNKLKLKSKLKESLKIKSKDTHKVKQFVNYSLPTNTLNTINSMAQISSEGIDSLLNSGTDFNQFSFMSKETQKINPISNHSHSNNHSKSSVSNSQSEHSTTNASSLSDSLRNGAIPTNFDWRNVSGVNYDSPIRKQGECGSCYAIAAISVVESRIRIKTNNNKKPLLSVASAVACSRYNQGCEGGYPYLVGKYGREHGFVNEACQKYNEDDTVCKKECFNSEVYRVSDYGYVGDYYGGCSEEAMMREIFNNGPIVVAINASPELYYYSGGIFTSSVRRTEGKFEKQVRPWEFTNHAVVCIGWGEELVNGEVVKYWILKNSWGKSWGVNGYFKLKKGMASADAQGVFLTPDI